MEFDSSPLYNVEIIQPDGESSFIQLGREGSDGLVKPSESVSQHILQGGTSETLHLDASLHYDLQQQGDYHMRVSREVPMRDGSGETIMVYSNVEKFTVEAPQPAK